MRVALGIEYDGATFCGWQRQKEVGSVQQSLEEALSRIANDNIHVVCAGRTDAGVHGTGQVVHFDTQVTRPERAWTLGVNTHLPNSVAVKWSTPVVDDFHARFSATSRRYRYIIYNHPLRGGVLTQGVTHHYYVLDENKMHNAAQALVGKHDFTSFRSIHCQANSPIRTIEFIRVTRRGRYIMVDVQANAFLQHMVRNIVGSLMAVGNDMQPEHWVGDVLALKDRTKAGMMAKPNGLYLVNVTYPEQFSLPSTPLGPLFWDD